MPRVILIAEFVRIRSLGGNPPKSHDFSYAVHEFSYDGTPKGKRGKGNNESE